MDPDTFLTAVYVIVDDLCQAKSGEVRPKRRGRKPVLSESEVITLALLSQWHGRGSERAFLRFAARHWRSYFPLLGQSGFNKRVRALRSRIAELALEVGRQVRRLMGTGGGRSVRSHGRRPCAADAPLPGRAQTPLRPRGGGHRQGRERPQVGVRDQAPRRSGGERVRQRVYRRPGQYGRAVACGGAPELAQGPGTHPSLRRPGLPARWARPTARGRAPRGPGAGCGLWRAQARRRGRYTWPTEDFRAGRGNATRTTVTEPAPSRRATHHNISLLPGN